MPALTPVPNTLKFYYKFQLVASGQSIGGFRTFWHYTAGTVSASNLDALANAVTTSWNTHVAAMVSTSQMLEEVLIEDIGSATGQTGASTTTSTGTRTGGELPVSNCVLINYSIARKYRGGKPRSYMPGGVDTDTTDGRHWTTAFQNAYLAALNSHTSDIVNNSQAISGMAQHNIGYYQGFVAVEDPITHRYRNVPQYASPPHDDLITLISVNPVIGTQRRRLRPG
jgi:hypothetical protein